MVHNRHKNACQELQRIYQNIRYFSDNNESKMGTLSPIGELAEQAITNHLACLAREGRAEQICFLLAQHTTESYPISKNLGDVTRLPADIQKKWLESCLEELKSLKNRNIYEVVDLSMKRKVIKNCWIFNIKSDSHYRSWLVAKEFS